MKKYILILITLIPLLLMSCNPDGIGIFYKISVEPHLSNSALSEKSVYKVVELAGTKYVLASGTVYKKNGSDWDAIKTPSGEIQAVSLEQLGAALYCVYADNNNSSLYSGDGSSWTIDSNFTNVSGGLSLVSSGINIFVTEHISDTLYKIHNLAHSANIDVSNFVRGAANDGAGVDYIIASAEINGYSAPEIVSFNGAFSTVAVTTGDLATAITDKTALGGILGDGTDIYITTKSGYLLSGLDTSVTTAINTVNTSALSNKKLGDMEIVTIGASLYLLIASNGGFYEMALPGGTPVSPTSATIGSTVYESVDLYTELVHSIFSDAANEFYIGSSNGLWYSDTTELTIK